MTRSFSRTKFVASTTIFFASPTIVSSFGRSSASLSSTAVVTFFLSANVAASAFGKYFLCKRQRRLVDRRLRRGEIGARALHDLFHREIGGEREAELLPELVRADAEIGIRARQQIFLQPLLVILESRAVFSCTGASSLLHLRLAIEHRAQGLRG